MPRGRQYYDPFVQTPPPPVDEEETGRSLRAFVAPAAGPYVLLDDIVLVLEDYAVLYDEQDNPSGAAALRNASAALKEPF